MGQVNFSAHGSGFGFLDFAQVKNILFGSGQTLLHFSVNFGCIWQQISKINYPTQVIEKNCTGWVCQKFSGWDFIRPIPKRYAAVVEH